MDKVKNNNISHNHSDIELILERTLLIVVLHKLFSFINIKKILSGLFSIIKNIKFWLKFFFVFCIFFLAFSWVCEFPSLYYNSHSSSVRFNASTEYFWVGVNIFDIIYTPLLIIFLIYLWKIRKIK
jgi:hypothetical protein